MFVVHYFHSVAWVTRLIQQGASAVLDVQHERNISGLWSSAESLRRCLMTSSVTQYMELLVKQMLKWIWYWKKICKKESVILYAYWEENWNTPQRQAPFTILISHSPPPSTHSYSLAYSSVCVIEPDKQCWGANASAAAAALTSTRGPLERRPDRQVVITSGFQLHLPSARLDSATSHRGLRLRTTEGRHGPLWSLSVTLQIPYPSPRPLTFTISPWWYKST